MEGEQRGYPQRSERICSREEKKRRKTSGHSSSSHDDRSSANSGLDVADRLTYLEQRMQMQEDEIQLLKMTLANVLQRLNISKENQVAAAGGRKTPGAKARPVSLALPSRPPIVTSSVASLKKSSTLPSGSTTRNYSPTPSRSGARSPSGGAKDGTRTRLNSAASTCKKIPESKEAAGGAGTRRVTHCKVTMQIYLSPLARKTGSSEAVGSAVPTDRGPTDAPNLKKRGNKPAMKKPPPSFNLNFQKSTTSTSTQQDTPSYRSPIKSPSQYFQICY
ncbi:echinoderm microtubule-associated protein-like 1 isoform X2 [Nematolebias whitei]|uniref:echinoderm microtubule-associated protein-like 1 isoform X2 n=1 Tax=Nematolebias whitei TaxID=451745 RepID=UPI00189817B2|nr:echinoderm microtubule-associated protein-like 1 isoform X2 [Nematolebias whitei]